MKNICTFLLVLLPAILCAQNDEESIRALINASAEAISGPKGKPENLQAFKNCFHEHGVVYYPLRKDTVPFLAVPIDTFVRKYGKNYTNIDFYEYPTLTEIQLFGNTATAQEGYYFSFSPKGPTERFGVNTYHLIKTPQGWKITALSWQESTPENPVPKRFWRKD